MNTEQYANKKAAHHSPVLRDGFESRPFAVQTKAIDHSHPLETQLDRADRFGHSLSRVQVLANPVQAKAESAIQREEEPEEDELQMKVDPVQRDEAEEDELAM